MKSPLAQLLLLTVVVGLGLWTGVKWFLKGTHEYSTTLDARSLSYLRDEPAASSSQPATESQLNGDATLQPVSPAVYARREAREQVQELADEEEEAVSAPEEETEPEAEVEDDEAQEVQSETATDQEPVMVELSASEQIALSATPAGTDKGTESAERADESAQGDAIRLGEDELEARENARIKRLAELGLVTKKQPTPTTAIDASLDLPAHCAGAAIAKVPVSLKFRYESSIIRGESLNALESLVSLYRQCDEGEFILAENPLGRQDATELLTQMRFDEVKYFFIQHSVSIDVVQFPEAK